MPFLTDFFTAMSFREKSSRSRGRRYRLRSKITISYVSLGKSHIFAEPDLPHLRNGDSYTSSYFLTDFPEAQMIKNHEEPQGCKLQCFTLVVSGIQRAAIRKGRPRPRHCSECQGTVARITHRWQPRLTCQGELCSNHQLLAAFFSSPPVEKREA